MLKPDSGFLVGEGGKMENKFNIFNDLNFLLTAAAVNNESSGAIQGKTNKKRASFLFTSSSRGRVARHVYKKQERKE